MKIEKVSLFEQLRWFWEWLIGLKVGLKVEWNVEPLNVYLNTQRRKREELKAKGRALVYPGTAAIRARCQHRKGGVMWRIDEINARQRISQALENGTSEQRSVIKHQLGDGTYMIICTRCNKKWVKDTSGYEEALKFKTNNTSSGSVLWQYKRQEDADKFSAAMSIAANS